MWAWLLIGLAVADVMVETFDAGELPPNMTQNHVTAEVVRQEQGAALRVEFQPVDWPNVYFAAPSGVWDWSAAAGLAVDITNPGHEAVDVCIRVDNDGANGMTNCNTARTSIRGNETVTFRAWFNNGDTGDFWGMRGLPIRGPISQGPVIDPSRITAFQVFLPLPDAPRTLILDNIRLFGQGGNLKDLVPMPFIDRFGQYRHADWPGKVHDEADLVERREAEAQSLASAVETAGKDRFGGWADGPQLQATGWFRTARVDGVWWLVTPEGRLFLSVGMDCVGTWEQTFVEGRDGWFEWLPEEDGPYKPFFGRQSNVHSMAERIGGEGRTFNWYGANLLRKYGDDWRAAWRDTAVARLRAWGFNTIGNWSQDDVIALNRMPYTATGGIAGDFRDVEGGAGYWGKMKDAFDPRFEAAADASLARVAERHGRNPWCIGYFVDNELSWGSPSGYEIAVWTLASPPDQPCRTAFIERLQAKYGELETLERAWATTAESWETLRAPDKPNEAAAHDLDGFVYEFARRYFDIVRAALKRHAPHQLYLGCRFSTASRSVVKACAEVADVVSFNLYQRTIDASQWTGERDLGKPIIIGEFHFGALDRGMFHPGLVQAEDQEDRARCYRDYVESVVTCPAFVGCHWFQYVDEPTTGRFFDGENYNIGFVSITDTPYPEMVEAAREIHGAMYRLRAQGEKR